MWNIDLKDMNQNISCYDSIIEMLLKSFNYEYQFLKLKNFSLHHFERTKDEQGVITRGIQNNNIIENVFKMKNSIIIKDNINNVSEFISDKLKLSPVGLFVDAYNCPWTLFYNKQHIKHFLLIVAYEENKTYCCLDNYYPQKGNINLSNNEIEKILDEVLLFNLNKEEINYEDTVKQFVKEYIKIPNESSFYDEMQDMIEYVSNLSPADIGTIENINTSFIIIKLKWIAEDKLEFISGLKYYEDRYNVLNLTNIYLVLEKIANEVNLLKAALIRYAITHVISKNKLKNYITNIYENNYKVCVELNAIFNK